MSTGPELAAVVTGGGRGLGRLVALALAIRGRAVGLIARSGDELDESVRLIEASGGVAASVAADVSDERAARDALAELRRQLGPVEVLINNAAVTGPAGPVWEVDNDAWWKAVEINLRGTFTCSQLVLPEMVARGRGRIVNVTSQAGVFRWPLASAYAVSKAAVIKLTENLASEARRHGIGVFSVHPGILPIGFSEAALADPDSDPDPEDPHRARLHTFIRHELDEGRGTEPARAVEVILQIASGRYDALSGRQLSVHDDLDAVLDGIDTVRRQGLYLLGLHTLPAGDGGRA